MRDLVESIPGVQTPKTFGQLTITVEQVSPAAAASLSGRLAAADADRMRLDLLLAGALALVSVASSRPLWPGAPDADWSSPLPP